MALGKQVVRIPTGGGLNEKVAANLVEPPSASEATNVQFQKDGSVQRRFGYEEYGDGTTDDFDPRYVIVGSSTTLASIDNNGVRYYDSYANQWNTANVDDAVDPSVPIGYIKTSVQNTEVPSGVTRVAGSFVTSTGYVLTCVYTGLNGSSQPTFRITIHKSSTGEFINSFTKTHTGGSAAVTRIIGASYGTTGRFWFDGGGGLYRTNTLSEASSSMTITVMSASIDGVFDVHEGNGTQNMCYVGATASGSNLYVGSITSAGSQTTRTITGVTIASCQFVAITPCSDLSGYVIGYHGTSGDLEWKETDTTFTATATYTGGTGSFSGFFSDGAILRACEMPSASGRYLFVADCDADMVTLLCDDSGVIDGIFGPIYGRVIGGPFILTDSARRYACLFTPSDDNASGSNMNYGADLCVLGFENTTTLLRWKSIAKVGAYNTIVFDNQVMPIMSAPWVGDTSYPVCISIPTIDGVETHILQPFPTDKVACDWRSTSVLCARGLSGVFNDVPYPLTLGYRPIISGTGVSGATSGTYTFQLVSTAITKTGMVIRSSPSDAVTRTIGATSTTISYVSPLYNDDEYVELYASTDGGSILYWCGETYGRAAAGDSSFVLPGSGSSFWTDIASNRSIYTASGELDSQLCPHPHLVATSQDRLWVVPGEQRDEVWFSKTPQQGYSTEFNSALRISIPQGGDITGIGALTDKMLIFKADSCFVIYGQGPTNGGLGSGFTPENLNYGVGCINSNSIVSYPGGVIFQSRQGVARIGQDLGYSLFGAAAEDKFRGATITSAACFSARSEVRFTTDDNLVIVHNYLFDRWSTFDGVEANSSTIYNGNWTYLARDQGMNVNVGYESATSPVSAIIGDYDAPEMTWSTPWIKLGTVQDYKRMDKAMLLLSQPSWPSGTHTSDIQVKVYYNYDSAGTTYATTTHTYLWSTISALRPIQIEVPLAYRQVQSIKFEITCTNPTGLGLALDAIDLYAGLKGKVFRAPSAQRG